MDPPETELGGRKTSVGSANGTDSSGGMNRVRTARGPAPPPTEHVVYQQSHPPTTQWVRKTPPMIGLREKLDGNQSGTVSPRLSSPRSDEIPRASSPVDAQSARVRTISNSSNSDHESSSTESRSSFGETVQSSWSSSQTPSQPPSIRLGLHTPSALIDARKPSPKVGSRKDITATSPPPNNTPARGNNNLQTEHSGPLPPLPRFSPNQSMPLLTELFEQAHALLDQGHDDWAITNYEQLRHVVSQLFHSVELIRKLLTLVKRVAPIFTVRHQERESTNRYKEVMYLAEKIGAEAAAEQIELNLLVADSYVLRSELAITDQELAVNIAAYANEALWLCQTYRLPSRIADCKSKIDLAEALFAAIFLVNTNIVLRLNQKLSKKPKDFPKVFKVIERTLQQLFKNQRWLMIRKVYQSGILEACTMASQRLGDDSYLIQILFIQTQVNLTMLNPSTQNNNNNIHSSNFPTRNSPSNHSNPTITFTSTSPIIVSPSPLKPSSLKTSGSSSKLNTSPLPGNNTGSNLSFGPLVKSFAPESVKSNWSDFRVQLENLRAAVDVNELADNLLKPEYVQNIQTQLNTKIVELVRSVFNYCVKMVGDPPCSFSVFALGSLSRMEAGPYSDLEYGFIIGDETKRESSYWKDLWTIFEFTLICFGERVGLHTDDQGSPKTPTFRGTPAQLLDLFLHPLDAHDISTAFSMLRPLYISSYPNRVGRELHDTYINLVNHVLQSHADSLPQHTKIGTLFLEDHVSLLPKWIPKEGTTSVELKTNFIQPLVYLVTDIALINGSLVSCSNAGVCSLVDLLTNEEKSMNISFSAEFGKSIKTLFLACYGLKVMAQLHYHEQYESDRVSLTPAVIGNNPTTNTTLSQNASNSTNTSQDTPFISGIYCLTRDQVYWLLMAESVVLKPLYNIMPQLQHHLSNSGSVTTTAHVATLGAFTDASTSPTKWTKIDPIIDTAVALLDPKFDPYTSSKVTALEDTKELIRSLIATLTFRDAPVPKFRHYYKQLSSDFKLLFRAAVTQHAVWQPTKVQVLSSVFDTYASPDGARPLIERLKAHWKDHIGVLDPALVSKIVATWDKKQPGGFPAPLRIRVAPPVGWPTQSRLKGPIGEPLVTTMKLLGVSKADGNIGYELALSLLHFALVGFGAPLLDLRPIPAPLVLSNSSNNHTSKEIPALFIEQLNGESLSWTLANEPTRIKSLDTKSFTEIAFVNMVIMCDAHAEDFVLEPIIDDTKTAYRLQRLSFAGVAPLCEPVLMSSPGKSESLLLKVFNIIFCMPNMMNQVNPLAVEDFCSLSPVQLMSKLVHELESANKDWKVRFDGPTVAALQRNVDPPPAPGTTSVMNIPQRIVSLIFERILKLQKALVNTPKATHLDILRAIDPIIGNIYGEALMYNNSFGTPVHSLSSPSLVVGSTVATTAASAPGYVFDRQALFQGASSNTAAVTDIIERLRKIEAKKDYPLHLAYTVSSSTPKNYSRIEKLRQHAKSDLNESSALPSTEPLYEKSDMIAQKSEVKSLLMNLSHSPQLAFPREETFKSTSMKENLLCSVDFGSIDTKKQRQALLSLFETIKFSHQLRIRHCPELDHTRLAKMLGTDAIKHLTILDLRGMVGLKQPTLSLIASLECLEYLNICESDVKGISTDKWVKRDALVMEKLLWLNVTKSAGLQHVLLRAPNLRHIDLSNCPALNEVKVWSGQKVFVHGLGSQQVPGGRLANEILSTSWWYSADAVPSGLEKQLLEVISGREKSLVIHTALNEAAAKVVAEVIKFSPTLENVDLSKSGVSNDDQVEAIIGACVFNTNVAGLDMTGCGIKATKVGSCTSQASARLSLKARF